MLDVSGGYVLKIIFWFMGFIMYKNYIFVISDCKVMLLFLNWLVLYIIVFFVIV